jgi:Fuc2NAc and GlcNAc transferase
VRPPIPTLPGTLLVVCALVAAALLTGLVRRIAAGRGVLDVPNPRSSHQVPTPRGGGLAIVVVTTTCLLVLALRGLFRWDVLAALTGGGLVVALVGFVDDRRSLSAAVRLGVHFSAALWALLCLGGLPPLDVRGVVFAPGWVGYALGALGIVWTLNLFNFMDGIDGIAASEAAFVALGGAALSALAGGTAEVTFGGLLLGAACLGFLTWNWPPARIFLGDVGSGYLGYVLAVLALAAARANPTALWTWLVLGGVFFVDATLTLFRRTARGERIHQAHRSHAYQLLAQRWGSHRRVTLTVTAVNVLWLLPCALLTTVYPARAPWITLGALAPIVVVVVIAGAGRRAGSAVRTSAGPER